METRCPKCGTGYSVDRGILEQARGMARCYNCGQVFDAFANSGSRPVSPLRRDQAHTGKQSPDGAMDRASELNFDPESQFSYDSDTEFPSDFQSGFAPDPPPAPDPELPFDAPPDLKPLPAAPHLQLDASDSLAPRRRRSRWWLWLLALVMTLGLLLQLGWWKRAELQEIPQLALLCSKQGGPIDCQLPERRDPQAFQVLERTLQVSDTQQNALQLSLRMRNGAAFAQPLPGVSVSLIGRDGSLVARRLLEPDEYLFPAPAGNRLVKPDEEVEIDLLLVDPGARASGFALDFY